MVTREAGKPVNIAMPQSSKETYSVVHHHGYANSLAGVKNLSQGIIE